MREPFVGIQIDDLAESLQPFAGELGIPVAVALVDAFGGMRLYIPGVWRPELEINCLSEPIARILCQRFGFEKIDVPRQALSTAGLRRALAILERDGLTRSQIARQLGITARAATRMRTKLLTARRARGLDERQADMLDWIERDKQRA